jgi:hypothetical protein
MTDTAKVPRNTEGVPPGRRPLVDDELAGPCGLAGPHDAELAARGSDEIVAFAVEHGGRFAVGGLFGAGGAGGAGGAARN